MHTKFDVSRYNAVALCRQAPEIISLIRRQRDRRAARRLTELGEDPADYRSIWFYF